MKGFATEIKKQAYMLVFQVKAKVYSSVELAEIEKSLKGVMTVDEATKEIQRQLDAEGYDTNIDNKSGTLSSSVN